MKGQTSRCSSSGGEAARFIVELPVVVEERRPEEQAESA
jgi:hypothetical protein